MPINNQAEITKRIPYDINTIINQLYQYRLFEEKLIDALCFCDKSLTNVCLINNYWFNHWKKLSCYEIMKLKIDKNINNTNLLSTFLTTAFMKKNLAGIYEPLDPKIDNEDIRAENLNNSQQICVDWESEFDIISPELWNLFAPNGSINQNSFINMKFEFLSNDANIINISDIAGYIIFWNEDKEKIGKFILKFENNQMKMMFVQAMNSGSFISFYKQHLSDIDEGKEKIVNYTEYINNIKCINKSQVKLPSKNPYKSPVGLTNVGMTCYMNSALQSLFNVKKLTNYLISLNHTIKNIDMSLPLLKAYLKTILHLSRKAEGSKKISEFAPQHFFNTIKNESEFNELAGDSYDVVRHFFQKMHEQLMPIKQEDSSVFTKYIINNPASANNLPPNDIQNLNAAINTYASHNKTIIANLFYFMERSITKCSICQYSTSNFNVQMSIIFALEDIRQWKYKNKLMEYINQNNMNNMGTNNNANMNNMMNYNNNMNMVNNNMNMNQNSMNNNNNMNMNQNSMNSNNNMNMNNMNMNQNSMNNNNNMNMNQNSMNNNNNMNMNQNCQNNMINNNMNMDQNNMNNNNNMNMDQNSMNNNNNIIMNQNYQNNMNMNQNSMNNNNNMNMNNMNNNNMNMNNNMMNNINNPMNNMNNNVIGPRNLGGGMYNGNMLNATPNNMINNMPMPNNMPNNMINNMPMPNNMANNMINNMPNNMVNNMSMPNNIGNNMINCNNIMIMMMNQNMFMNNMMQMYNMFPNVEVPKTVDLKDGFQHYKKDNQLGGQNKLYCQKCGNTCDHIQSNHFYTLPEYLVINLNRGEGNKYQVGATFDEFLDLTNEVQTNLDCNKYRLIGVITHLGPHGTGGHYIAYGFLEEKNMWYKFDDSRVTESTFDEAKTSKPFDNYRCDPYILFYHRLKN